MYRALLIIGSTLLSLPLPAQAAEAAEIARGVHLIRGQFVPGSQPDGNTVIFQGRTGSVVVDTGRHEAHTRRIVDFARESGKPVLAVINTHWHLDHIGGNLRLRRQYPEMVVFASPALDDALSGFLANYRRQLVQMIESAPTEEAKKGFQTDLDLIDAGRQLGPDIVIRQTQRRKIGGRTFRLGLESHAVTAGDVWVYEPRSRVLVAGDLITLPAPFLDTACPRRWRESLSRLAAIDFSLVVPGHGPAMQRSDFETYRRAFGNLLDCAASSREKGACISGWSVDAGALLAGQDEKFTRSLMGYYVDLLRGDPAKTAALCGS